MASTVEALIAAVQMDGAGQEQVNRVMVRFGLEHRLLDPIQRLWIHQAVKSKLSLPDRFFVGHHLRLQKDIFETHLMRPTVKGRKRRQPGRVRGLWESVKKLWRGPVTKPRPKHPRLQTRPQVVFRSSAQPKEVVKPLMEGPRPTATKNLSPPTKDVAPSQPMILGEHSAGRSEGSKPAAAPEQTASREDPVEAHKAAEESPSEAPKPSQPPKRRPGPALPKADTAADDDRVPDTSSPSSNKAGKDQKAADSSKRNSTTSTEKKVSNGASKDQTAAISSNQNDETTGTEKKVLNEACKDQKAAELSNKDEETTSTEGKLNILPLEASGAESIEATEEPIEVTEDDSRALLGKKLRMMELMSGRLKSKRTALELRLRELNLAKEKKDPAQVQRLLEMQDRQRLIRHRIRVIKGMLKRPS